MDNKDNEQNQKSENKIGQNIAHSAGKAAATVFGGALGGKIYDIASKTELGQQLEKNISNKAIPNMGQPSAPGGMSGMGSDAGLDNSNKNNGLSSPSGQNKNSKDNSNSSENGENGSGEASSEGIISKWKSLPQPIKAMILTITPYFFTIIGIVLIVILLMMATTGVAEGFYEKLVGIGDEISSFFNDAGNFFSNIENSKAEKAEKAYYQKLQQVYEEFKEKYGVEIDTTMITATLFYGKTMGDYSDEDIIDENGNDSLEDDDTFYEGDMTSSEATAFYKLAKQHIKTLAKYMVIEEAVFNACVPEEDAKKVTTPYTPKDVAATWTSVSALAQNNNSIWNSRNTFNYVSDNAVPKKYISADGTEVTINWCNYKDAESQLKSYYEADKQIYLNSAAAYNTCMNPPKTNTGTSSSTNVTKTAAVSSEQQECLADCSDRFITGSSQYNACIGTCNSIDSPNTDEDSSTPENKCAAEKVTMDAIYKNYYDAWLKDGLYNADGKFTCKTTEKWGYLDEFDDTKKYLNRTFSLDLVNKTSVSVSDLGFGEVSNTISCSSDPSISYTYKTDLSEEGVYYYKLLTPTSSGIFQSKQTFIQRYYPDYIDNTNEETIASSSKKVVDDIFLLYQTIADRQDIYCYTPSNTTNTSTGVSSSSSTTVVTTSRKEFIASIANDVIVDMQNSGILASVTLAQAAIESRNGGSGLSTGYNNYFGMTAGSCAPERLSGTTPTLVKSGTNGNNCSPNAYWNGDVVWMCNKEGADCQWYRVYDSVANSIHDHSRLLSTSKYNCQGISDPHETLICLQKAPYSAVCDPDTKKCEPNPDYVEDLMNTIEANDLTQFDIGEWNGETLGEYGSAGLGTICYSTIALKEIANGEGTLTSGFLGSQRTQLFGTTEYYTFWQSNNNLFYRSNHNLLLQCTWYAHGRALEILTSNGMDLITAQRYLDVMHGNAGLWYGQNQYFNSSTAVNSPKVGAIVVWSRAGEPGHVAIIEDIQYDSDGNPVSVSLSEGGVSIDGFRYTQTRTMDYIRHHGSYNFVGYVYLLG